MYHTNSKALSLSDFPPLSHQHFLQHRKPTCLPVRHYPKPNPFHPSIPLHQHTRIFRPAPSRPLQLRPLHQKPIHHMLEQLPTQTRLLHPGPALNINRPHLAPRTTPPHIEKPQHHTSQDQHRRSRRPITEDQIREVPLPCQTRVALPRLRRIAEQDVPARTRALETA